MKLSKLNTLGLESMAPDFFVVNDKIQLKNLVQELNVKSQIPLILGGGSNLVLPKLIPDPVLWMQIFGKEILHQDENDIYVKANAGENWSDFVEWTLEQRAFGLENLVLIPGTVGASPVQNIGAYGVEVMDFVDLVHATHRITGVERVFNHKECKFKYRDSFFKTSEGQNWIITEVIFKLKKKSPLKASYGELKILLEQKNSEINALSICEAVKTLRNAKLPNPKIIGNAGSFFKNPIVPLEFANQLKAQYPAIPCYEVEDNESLRKISAGWMIDQVGWKGKSLGPVGMYEKQALILVNHGGATDSDVKKLSDAVIRDVYEKFHINLEPEPVFW